MMTKAKCIVDYMYLGFRRTQFLSLVIAEQMWSMFVPRVLVRLGRACMVQMCLYGSIENSFAFEKVCVG